MPFPYVAGTILTAALLNELAPVFALKTVDETVNNSAALQNDNHLFVPVAVGRYIMDMSMIWASPTSADLKFDWTTPAGSAGWWTVTAPTLGSGASAPYLGALSWASIGTLEGGLYADNYSRFTGVLIITTAGTLQFRWAQNTAAVVDSIVRTNSGLLVRKV